MSRRPSPDEIKLWRAAMMRPLLLPVPVRRGRPAHLLDLHGLTVNAAHRATLDFLDTAYHHKLRAVVIITGRSGQIRREFERWLANHPRIATLHESDRGGAYRVRLSVKS